MTIPCIGGHPDAAGQPKTKTALMTTIGTPLTERATRVMLLGAGELGKECAIEAQRLGVEVVSLSLSLSLSLSNPISSLSPFVLPLPAP